MIGYLPSLRCRTNTSPERLSLFGYICIQIEAGPFRLCASSCNSGVWRRIQDHSRKGYGGRGRNRTYNLSVKSRMLCQLSYASTCAGREISAELTMGERSFSERPFRNIAQKSRSKFLRCAARSVSEREGKTALNTALSLSKIERTAILCEERTVALCQQITHVNQRFYSIRQHAAANRLA